MRGDVATRYKLREKQIDVLVRSVDNRAASIEEVRNLIVNPGAEHPVTLSAVADVRLAVGPAEVRRIGQERVAVVSANLAGGDLGSAVAALQQIVASTQLPVGTVAFLSGQSEEMTDSFRSLQFVLLLAIFLVYLVMASQFESLIHPFVILLTIPLAVIGAVWALWLTSTTLNVVAYIGLIMLAGIVVNQSIVLIDAVNQARERGMTKARCHRRGGAAAPAAHPDHQADHDPRPAADGARHRRRRRGAGADGDHGHRRRAAHDVPHAARDPGRLLGARPQGLPARDAAGIAAAAAHRRHKLRPAMRHTRLALERPITTVMVALAVLAVGLISGRLLRLEAMPDITFPGMQVVIPYPGSTPEEIEQLIVRPVEEALATLSGVEEIRASAQSDQAQFQILFDWDRDANAAAFDVRTKLDSIRSQLPAGADRLLMFAFNASDQAIVIIRISADEDLTDQYDMLEKYLQRPIQRLDGVARVELEGVQPREVRVLVDPNRLAAYGVDVRSLRTLLEASNFSVSAGEITENGARLTVRPIGEFNDLQDVRDIVISAGRARRRRREDRAGRARADRSGDAWTAARRSASTCSRPPRATWSTSRTA